MGSGYLRAKFAQEKLIKESSIPFSIVRATQFFEFLTTIADAATHGHAVRVPPVRIQPIAADCRTRGRQDCDRFFLNGTVEIGGPEPFYLDGLLQRVLGARNDPREVIVDAHARYFGTELKERSLLPGDEAELGEIRFDDWLGRTAHPDSDFERPEPAADGVRTGRSQLKENEFRVAKCRPDRCCSGRWLRSVQHRGEVLCATQAMCTHKQGPLSEGSLDGTTVTCPLHGAQFNVWTGAVLRGPAKDCLRRTA